MALFGVHALWLVSIGMSAPRWTPEWISALAAALALPVAAGTALFAVLGAFALWRGSEADISSPAARRPGRTSAIGQELTFDANGQETQTRLIR